MFVFYSPTLDNEGMVPLGFAFAGRSKAAVST